MARGVEKVLGPWIEHGVVVVKYGHKVPLDKIRVMEAAHPVPDKKGLMGAGAILDLLAETGRKDLVICLLSGGGSALIDNFHSGITLADVQKATNMLLACGASISEVNTIRKHISTIKGGGLAARAWPSTVITLMLSDVIGDDPDVIASGPTVPDPTTFSDAIDILVRYGLVERFPKRIADHIRRGIEGEVPETPKRRNRFFRRTSNVIIGNNGMAVTAAAKESKRLGYRPMILTTRLAGEARDTAKTLAAVAKEISQYDRPVKKPACLLAGGETTVTLKGRGKGGRNQELALAAALELRGFSDVALLSGGTDGTDGPTDMAGAVVDGKTWRRAAAKGLDPKAFLDNNDAYHFFETIGGHIRTGPTLTNVMDVVVALVR
jgi:hydroxypyruvate reductase